MAWQEQHDSWSLESGLERVVKVADQKGPLDGTKVSAATMGTRPTDGDQADWEMAQGHQCGLVMARI